MKHRDLNTIHLSTHQTPYGQTLIASTSKGLCYLAFHNTKEEGLTDLKKRFPTAKLLEKSLAQHQQIAAHLERPNSPFPKLTYDLKGSPFQLSVWQALQQIPYGQTCTYSDIARAIDHSKAVRAVGTAIGSNPIAYLIPCHRVIQKSGKLGGYRWGIERKKKLIGLETRNIDNNQLSLTIEPAALIDRHRP